jgi:hypothetical protein
MSLDGGLNNYLCHENRTLPDSRKSGKSDWRGREWLPRGRLDRAYGNWPLGICSILRYFRGSCREDYPTCRPHPHGKFPRPDLRIPGRLG